MAKICFLGWNEIQFRRFKLLSEVVACKKNSRRELIKKAYCRRISFNLLELILGGTENTVCQWSTKSSRLCEEAKWFISSTGRASSMWRRIDFTRCCCYPQCINNKEVLVWKKKYDFWTTHRALQTSIL